MSFLPLSPQPTVSDTFGLLITRGNVEAAVLGQLQSSWSGVIFYIAEIERQNGIPARTIPVPKTFRGGLDFETWQGDETPTVIVMCEPTGSPERAGGGEYEQMYDVQVATVVAAQGEEDARHLADCYGIATAGCLLQHGGLGGLATETVMTAAPQTHFASETGPRTIQRSVVGLHVMVQAIVTRRFGPIPPPQGSPPPDPYAPQAQYPTVQSTNVTVVGE